MKRNHLTLEDLKTIDAIVKRYDTLTAHELDRTTTEMDIELAFEQVGLDLQKLLIFPDFDFLHDVLGIKRHVDRREGLFNKNFFPLCSLSAA